MLDVRDHGGGYGGGGILKTDILKYDHSAVGKVIIETTTYTRDFIHAIGGGLAIQCRAAVAGVGTSTLKLIAMSSGSFQTIKTVNISYEQNDTLVDVDYDTRVVVFRTSTGRLICIDKNLDTLWDITFPIAATGALGITIRKGIALIYNSVGAAVFLNMTNGQIIQSFTLSSFNYSGPSPCIDFDDTSIIVQNGNSQVGSYRRSDMSFLVNATTDYQIMGLLLLNGNFLVLTRYSTDNTTRVEYRTWNGSTFGAKATRSVGISNQNIYGANKNLLRLVKGIIFAHSYDLYALSYRGSVSAFFPRAEFASSSSVLNNVTTDGTYITCNDSSLKLCTAKIDVTKQ